MLSTMSTGYATDDSTESNKRARFSNDTAVASAASGGTKGPQPNMSPVEAARKVAKVFLASLHHKMHDIVEDASNDLIVRHATWFRKKQALLAMKNDPDKIPGSAEWKMTLQPVEGVESGQGFKDLAKETQGIVLDCRRMLAQQIVKCTEMNVERLALNIQEAFVDYLPKIAKLVVADEGIDDEKYRMHTAVADLMTVDGEQILEYFQLGADEFKQLYCRVNGLDTFPSCSNPPLNTGTQHSVSDATATQFTNAAENGDDDTTMGGT